jgi:hypothetical protein
VASVASASSRVGDFRLADPFLQQHEGRLALASRSVAEQALLRQVADHVDAALAGGRYAAAVERRVDLGTSERAAALERAHQQAGAAREGGLVELERAIAARRARDDARRQQPQHPARVLRRHEVQRPAHRPRPDDHSGRDRAFDRRDVGVRQPQARRPEPAAVVLGLDGAHPAHELGQARVARTRELLIAEPLRDHVEAAHAGRPSCVSRKPQASRCISGLNTCGVS